MWKRMHNKSHIISAGRRTDNFDITGLTCELMPLFLLHLANSVRTIGSEKAVPNADIYAAYHILLLTINRVC